jgi:hypothetical protein
MNEKEIINTVLSKLDFSPIYHKIIKKDNKIFIKCHSYFINIFNNYYDNIILKTIEYKQPSIFVNNNYINIIDDNDNKKELYICITYADIIIDLYNKNYKIVKSNFNIRKPTNDKFNLFQKILTNLNTHYFIINYDTMFINYYYSNFNSNIYHINNIDILFINGDNDNDNDNDNETIIIDLLMDKTNIILPDIHTKPMINNKIKITTLFISHFDKKK